jgi:hypothetical protein
VNTTNKHGQFEEMTARTNGQPRVTASRYPFFLFNIDGFSDESARPFERAHFAIKAGTRSISSAVSYPDTLFSI